MSISKEIEDSLQVCREIQSRITSDGMITDYDEKKSAVKQHPENNEIDRILKQYDDTAESSAQFSPPPSDEGVEPEPVPPSDEGIELEPVFPSDEGIELEPVSPSDEGIELESVFPSDEGIELEPVSPSDESTEQEPVTSVPVRKSKKKKEKKESAKTSRRHPLLRTLLSLLICLFTALILTLVINQYVAHHTSVEGSSMETTLADGDRIIVENVSYRLHEPERFDIIVFPNAQGVNYIKRIIALPGETIQIIDGYIYINGDMLDENYGNEVIVDPGLAADKIVLGQNEYFVLGDNRNGSIDSRRAELGNVKREQIKGKAWLRFYPFSKIETIR